MRKLFLIFLLFIGATVFAQDRAETLEELLQLVEEARIERSQPQECPYKLYPYELKIDAPNRDFTYTIYLPNDYINKYNICGNLYDFEGFISPVIGKLTDNKIVLELSTNDAHWSRRLIFETNTTGIYIDERFGWDPYELHEGNFVITNGE